MSIPFLPPVSQEPPQDWQPPITNVFTMDEQWRETVIQETLVTEYSARIELVRLHTERKSTMLTCTGECPACHKKHYDHFVFINTPGYNTTLFICHATNARYLLKKLPF